MKHIVNHLRAKLRGRSGLRTHGKIIDNVFATRDALNHAAQNMAAEVTANDQQISRLRTRSSELLRAHRHAKNTAARLHEFFLPR